MRGLYGAAQRAGVKLRRIIINAAGERSEPAASDRSAVSLNSTLASRVIMHVDRPSFRCGCKQAGARRSRGRAGLGVQIPAVRLVLLDWDRLIGYRRADELEK